MGAAPVREGAAAPGAPRASAERAVALVRALGTLAEGDPSYLSFARDATLSLDSVRRLASALSPEGLRALTEAGRTALARGRAALEDVLDAAHPLRAALEVVGAANAELERLAGRSRSALAALDGPMPDLLGPGEARALAAFQSRWLSALCYFGSLLYGSERIAALRDVQLDAGNPEQVHAALAPALERLARDVAGAAPCGAWRLEPIIHASGPCVPALRGYLLRWSTDAEYRMALETGGFREANPGLAVAWEGDLPSYRGLGYLVGTAPDRAFALRSPGVHRELPVNAFGPEPQRLGAPLQMLAEHFGGDDAFCVDPRDFAAALDRFVRCAQMGGL